MANEKKFLDQAGVQYLWSQLSLHDYPNNETLVAVINAIDETKADAEHTHAPSDITGVTTTAAEINHLTGTTSNIQTQITNLSNELDNYYLKTEADVLHQEMEDYVDTEVAALVGAAPETLDTIGELAAAFEENATVIEALDASITNKQDKVSDTLILVDTVTGTQHKIQIQNGQLVSFPVE